jgi:hypothetical protein
MKYLIAILVQSFGALWVYSQSADSCVAGVYLTQEDFVNNHLSHQINTNRKGNKLDFTFPADLTLAVKLVTPDTTLKFDAGTIYGYSDCGKIFRYYHGGKELNAQEDYYQLKEAGGMIIYSSAFVSGEEIFYSLTLTSPIHRLTIENLKQDFKSYPNFIEVAKKLNQKPADGLSTKDENDKYEINILYSEKVKGQQ